MLCTDAARVYLDDPADNGAVEPALVEFFHGGKDRL
jgi:hypothetical protein